MWHELLGPGPGQAERKEEDAIAAAAAQWQPKVSGLGRGWLSWDGTGREGASPSSRQEGRPRNPWNGSSQVVVLVLCSFVAAAGRHPSYSLPVLS
jgi:hypothetical protein